MKRRRRRSSRVMLRRWRTGRQCLESTSGTAEDATQWTRREHTDVGRGGTGTSFWEVKCLVVHIVETDHVHNIFQSS